ncbi:MAG: hypothetical protein EA343_15340 [Nodularia sp. (in: Bacteria)]|nr:MAG: hypothetical protein EA343_15340 [Nodularia sp. (in: cyanobacteria)]
MVHFFSQILKSRVILLIIFIKDKLYLAKINTCFLYIYWIFIKTLGIINLDKVKIKFTKSTLRKMANKKEYVLLKIIKFPQDEKPWKSMR